MIPRSRASGASDSSSVTSAPHPAAITTPVSSKRGDASRESPRPSSRRARPSTRATDTSEPANADASTSHHAPPAIIATSAKPAAPPDTPSTYGSASGLRNSTCSSAPASASSAPHAKPASARGRRSVRTISANSASPPCGTSDASACHGDIGTLPIDSDATNSNATAAASAAQIAVARAALMPRTAPHTTCVAPACGSGPVVT